jgi:hypothetical protein
MEKIDLRKQFKELYSPKEKPEIVDIPKFGYLTYTGRGEPGGVAYTVALNALYSAIYTLKFAFKKDGRDFMVMPLEGLWWWDNPKVVNLEDVPPRETWNWTSMIMVPDLVTHEMLEELKPEIVEKKGNSVKKVRLERFKEGLSAQILHVGAFSDEPRSQRILHSFIKEQGYRLRGIHHEIYLSNPRRTAPERWKTILRHPIEKV